jgi:exonuclease III
MAGGVCLRAGAAMAAVMLGVVGGPSSASAQTAATFKVAYYNIKSGKGQVGLTGAATFADTTNCTDTSKALNAWGVGLVQQHLRASVGNDPSVLALGLGESWASVCGSPENVRQTLGWKARSSERNGVAMVARHGFAGPEEWIQLDTTLNSNPADTKWVLRRAVCVDASCSQSMPVFVAHWYGTGSHASTTYARQAQQTVEFVTRAGGDAPHVMVGDLNVFEGTAKVCNQSPNNTALAPLRAAGYIDAWPLLHGSAEGFTGMVNRNGCGDPMGYAWKRIDYAWSPSHFQPLSVARFGVVTAGLEAPSDHYGIIAEYSVPGAEAPTDTTAPIVNILSPVGGTALTTGTAVDIAVDATDDLGVSRVELLQDGAVTHTLTAAPYQLSCGMVTSTAGTRTLVARAYDAAGNMAASALVSVVVHDPVLPPAETTTPTEPTMPASPGEIILYALDATTIAGNWQLVGDSTAADGVRIWNPDAGLAKLNTASGQPADYFELTFDAEAGVAYRLWLRGRADRNHWGNDSVYFQFSGSVNATGAPVYRIGTTSATWLGVERCSGCPLRNWGWNDNGYGGAGPLVYFATSGRQTLRVQRREDGISIDQIVLSPADYLVNAPGADVDDTTILEAATTAPPPATEILITASALKTLAGGWRMLADASAAGGAAFGHPDAGAAKLSSALAAPTHYVELTFPAEAGLSYRLWIRGRADRDHWANDSVFVQFDGSVTAAGQPVARVGTTGSYSVNLEEDAHWGVSGWGWQDNGYGAGVLGPLVTFDSTGIQTIRIQTREDGLRIDQIVLSSEKYLTVAPGALKNDATILK